MEQAMDEQAGGKKPRRKRSQGTINREKGHNAERLYAQKFRESGMDAFSKCKTSRYGSKLTDNCQIDLIFIPLNVQIKAGKQTGLKPHQVLKEMSHLVEQTFPEGYPERTNLSVLIHEKEVGAGHRRTEFDSMVHMTFDTFFKLLNQLHEKGKIAEVTILSDESGTLQPLLETPEGEHSTEES